MSEQRALRPTPTDGFPSPTSELQAATENILKNRIPIQSSPSTDKKLLEPVLQKNLHLEYLLRNLVQGFPSRYTSQDASQPWLIFWTLQAFSVLGVGLDEKVKKRTTDTVLALQHPNGGFAGGPGQAAHLLPTYASICALAIVGKPGEGGGWDQIDRKKCYDFFMSLKQPDGSFLVAHHAEVDVRGIYCLLVAATILNILTPELLEGTPEFIASCQTYEGGFCNASFPGWAQTEDKSLDPTAPRPPIGEAHGGYTFCATASWVLLQPYIRSYYTGTKPAPTINTASLLRWIVNMQGNPIELGGFKGRTNKLVDGCYSWWVGGCAVLAEGLLGVDLVNHEPESHENDGSNHEGWDDVDDSIFNRKALQEYILYAAQHHAGGLVDKPPKFPDAYHTLYCLSGLSSAQHRVVPSETRKADLLKCWNTDEVPKDKLDEFQRDAFSSVLSWQEEEGTSKFVGGAVNRVNATHPIFNLTVTHSEGIVAHFYGRKLPARQFRKSQTGKSS